MAYISCFYSDIYSTIMSRCLHIASWEIKLDISINNYDLYRCRNCHLLITDISKSKKINEKFYSKKYLSHYLEESNRLKRRFEDKLSQIEKYKKGGKILDLGCGAGLFLET